MKIFRGAILLIGLLLLLICAQTRAHDQGHESLQQQPPADATPPTTHSTLQINEQQQQPSNPAQPPVILKQIPTPVPAATDSQTPPVPPTPTDSETPSQRRQASVVVEDEVAIQGGGGGGGNPPVMTQPAGGAAINTNAQAPAEPVATPTPTTPEIAQPVAPAAVNPNVNAIPPPQPVAASVEVTPPAAAQQTTQTPPTPSADSAPVTQAPAPTQSDVIAAIARAADAVPTPPPEQPVATPAAPTPAVPTPVVDSAPVPPPVASQPSPPSPPNRRERRDRGDRSRRGGRGPRNERQIPQRPPPIQVPTESSQTQPTPVPTPSSNNPTQTESTPTPVVTPPAAHVHLTREELEAKTGPLNLHLQEAARRRAEEPLHLFGGIGGGHHLPGIRDPHFGHHHLTDPTQTIIQHGGHTHTVADAEEHGGLIFGTMLITMMAAQLLLVVWKKYSQSTFDQATLLAVWLIPVGYSIYHGVFAYYRMILLWLVFTIICGFVMYKALTKPIARSTPRLVYQYFYFVFRISYTTAFIAYLIMMAHFLGFHELIPSLLPSPSTAFLLGFYGLYFGLLGRDLAHVTSQGMAVSLGFVGKKGEMPSKVVPMNICAICTHELVHSFRPTADGQTAQPTEKIYQLNCSHQFHDWCLRGWTMIGKRDTCPQCNEKVQVSKDTMKRPWETAGVAWSWLLDALRYLIVYNPIVLLLAHGVSTLVY